MLGIDIALLTECKALFVVSYKHVTLTGWKPFVLTSNLQINVSRAMLLGGR